MILTNEQVKNFKEALEKAGVSFEKYTEDEIIEIVNGVVNIYGTLVDINLRLKRKEEENKESDKDSSAPGAKA